MFDILLTCQRMSQNVDLGLASVQGREEEKKAEFTAARVQVGRSSDRGHKDIWAGVRSSQCSLTRTAGTIYLMPDVLMINGRIKA